MNGRFFSPQEQEEVRAILAGESVTDADICFEALAIDSSVTRDRDDAIAFERHEDGGFTLHVCIADIASLVSRHSALETGARGRAFTLYRSEFNLPMFPRELSEGEGSLNEGQARRVMVTSLRFDAMGNSLGIRFSRRTIRCRNLTYEQMAERIDAGEEPYADWARMAMRMAESRKGEALVGYYDPDTGRYVNEDGEMRAVESGLASAYILVQECMLQANHRAALWMRDRRLPFLYRNHTALVRSLGRQVHSLEEARSLLGVVNGRVFSQIDLLRAVYEPEALGHVGLGMGAYGHATSPIRRYVDLVNQRCQHYAIDAVALLARALSRETGLSEAQAQDRLWADGEALDTLLRAGNAQQALPPPYAWEELTSIAAIVNRAMEEEKRHLRSYYDEEVARWLTKVFPPADAPVQTDMAKLRNFPTANFSRLLEGAAREGHMNETFYAHVTERLDSGDVDKRGYIAILKASTRHLNHHWQTLKEHALELLKGNATQAYEVLATMAQRSGWKELYVREATLMGPDGKPWHAAAVIVEIEGKEYATPEFACIPAEGDAEYLQSMVKHAARMAFLSAVAHGSLVEVEKLEARLAFLMQKSQEPFPFPDPPELASHPDSRFWLEDLAQANGWRVVWDVQSQGRSQTRRHEVRCLLYAREALVLNNEGGGLHATRDEAARHALRNFYGAYYRETSRPVEALEKLASGFHWRMIWNSEWRMVGTDLKAPHISCALYDDRLLMVEGCAQGAQRDIALRQAATDAIGRLTGHGYLPQMPHFLTRALTQHFALRAEAQSAMRGA